MTIVLKMHHDDYKGVTCGCDFNHDDVLVVYNDYTYDDDDADAVIVVDNDELMVILIMRSGTSTEIQTSICFE